MSATLMSSPARSSMNATARATVPVAAWDRSPSFMGPEAANSGFCCHRSRSLAA